MLLVSHNWIRVSNVEGSGILNVKLLNISMTGLEVAQDLTMIVKYI